MRFARLFLSRALSCQRSARRGGSKGFRRPCRGASGQRRGGGGGPLCERFWGAKKQIEGAAFRGGSRVRCRRFLLCLRRVARAVQPLRRLAGGRLCGPAATDG